MTSKLLRIYEAQYMKALCYADVYGCDLNLQQFACCPYLDADEYERTARLPGDQGVGV